VTPDALDDPPRLGAGGRFWPYALVFVVALALRLAGISLQNLWYDEHWTLRVALVPLRDLLDVLIADEGSKPPLYFVLMHYWVKISSSELWLRAPSAFFGAVDCVAAAAIGRQIFGRARGAWLGWLLVFAPFHIYYSQEARPYAMWGAFVTLTFLFHVKWNAAPRLGYLIAYAISASLACYTFTYSIFLLPFSVLFTWLYRPKLSTMHRSQMALANGLVMLAYVPWLIRVIGAFTAGVGLLPLSRGPTSAAAAYTIFSLGLGVPAGPSLEQLRVLGFRIFEEAPLNGATLIFGVLLLAAIGVSGCLLLWRVNRSAFYFGICGVTMLVGGGALLNIVNPDVPLNPRYVLPAIVPLLVLILAGCGGVAPFNGWRRWLAFLYFITVGHSLANQYFNPKYARDDLRCAAVFVRELQPQPEQVIICSPHLADIFKYYLQRPTPLLPLAGPSGADTAARLREIHDKLAGLRRFVLVYSRPDHGDRAGILRKALTERYRVTQHHHWTGVDAYVFEAPVPSQAVVAPAQ
jgi:uncharacterized membrane protein